jgi:hypothetical protein
VFLDFLAEIFEGPRPKRRNAPRLDT